MKALILILALLANQALAADTRPLAPLPPAAQESLREEMLGNLLAINEILTLLAAGKVKEAGQLAETSLGQSAMGKHRGKPLDARPGAHMPPAMHEIGIDGHRAVSEFAKAAASGDREKALAELPKLTAGCVACHYSWRTR
ncbi:MAG: cytochrome C [Betaproteobacteria bacterium]|nr:cytochrome C [Betaproteobacteria bacterium]